MSSRPRSRPPGWAERVYDYLLRAYPAAFHEDYGNEMRSAFRARWREERNAGAFGLSRLLVAVLLDTLRTAFREHLDMLIQDVRYAWRSLTRRQNWSFTIAAVLTLGLGIGAVTAIFSVVYAVLLAPLPFRDGDRVVRIYETNLSKEIPQFAASIPNLMDWRARAHSFSGSRRRAAGRACGPADVDDVFPVDVLPLADDDVGGARAGRSGGARPRGARCGVEDRSESAGV
jgi:hypothetical protein